MEQNTMQTAFDETVNATKAALGDAAAAARESGEKTEIQYIAAAIDALNALITRDVTPRLITKIARFRKILSEYAKSIRNAPKQTRIEFEGEGAKDANGENVTDIYTV